MKIIYKILAKLKGLHFNMLAYTNPQKLKKDGFDMFCTPWQSSMKPYHIEFLNSGKDEVMDIDGNIVQTYKWGSGSKGVLLVHGWGSHTFRWKNYVSPLMESGFTVYALDAPAHGNSNGKIMNLVIYERVIAAFLKRQSAVSHIISHSIGGFAATYYLHQNTDTAIEKIVIMATPSKVAEFFDHYVKQLNLSQKSLKIIQEQFEKELGQKIPFFSIVDFGKKLNTKALIIHDKSDQECLYTEAVKLAAVWDNAQLHLTERLGHELKSKEIVEKIIAFLR